jgi:hypothetical protein
MLQAGERALKKQGDDRALGQRTSFETDEISSKNIEIDVKDERRDFFPCPQ